MKNKSQISFEFVVLLGLGALTVIIFAYYIGHQITDSSYESEREKLQDTIQKVEREITLAAHISDGYSRNFTIPEQIQGNNYSITIEQNVLYAVTENNIQATIPIVNVTGNIQKGNNRIEKKGGNICLNVVTC